MDNPAVDNDSEKGVAYHEAGHAVFYRKFGMTLEGVSIKPGAGYAGVAQMRPPHPIELSNQGVQWEETKERDQFICHRIMMTLAGEVAQKEFYPASFEEYQVTLDRKSVKSSIRDWSRYANEQEQESKIDELYEYTKQLVKTPWCWNAIDAVAKALLLHKELTGRTVKELITVSIKKTIDEAAAAGMQSPDLNCPHCADYVER